MLPLFYVIDYFKIHNIMIKRNLLSIIGLPAGLICLLFCATPVRSQTSASIQPDRTRNVGDTVQIPVHITGTNVLNMAFYVDYDHTILTPHSTPYLNVVAGLEVTGYNTDWQPGTLGLFLDAIGLEGQNYENDRIITLVFTLAKAGSTPMVFRTSPLPLPISGIWNELGLPIEPIAFTGNTITALPVVPPTRIVQNDTVHSGEIMCYDATLTITVAGNGSVFLVEPNGQATFVAGQNIVYLPGTRVMLGGYMHGYITLNHQYCDSPAPGAAGLITTATASQTDTGPGWSIYPNPTSETITIDVSNLPQQEFNVALYNMQGALIRSQKMVASQHNNLSLSDQPSGIYFLRLIWDNGYRTIKIIKN